MPPQITGWCHCEMGVVGPQWLTIVIVKWDKKSYFLVLLRYLVR